MESDGRRLQVEGELEVVETTGRWGVYAGERILIGPGDSFRDDLGVKIREMFEAGAQEALALGAGIRSVPPTQGPDHDRVARTGDPSGLGWGRAATR